MSIESYAQFLLAMGHEVRHSSNIYWFNAHPHIYMSFPFDQRIEPSDVNWKEVLGQDGWAVRFPCDLKVGRPSYRIIADRQDYSLECLSGKARNQTRRGLEQCEVRPIAIVDLMARGLELNRETMIRQKRKVSSDFDDYWKRYYINAMAIGGADAWGAFVGGELAAFLIAFRMDDVAHILIVRSSTNFLKQYPNNALMYGYLSYALRSGMREVSIGLESIQEGMDTLDRFKLGMGFRKQPIGQRIVLRRPFEKLLGGVGLRAAKLALGQGRGNEHATKLAGLLRWYSEQPEEF